MEKEDFSEGKLPLGRTLQRNVGYNHFCGKKSLALRE
jgi:hypothetical protein